VYLSRKSIKLYSEFYSSDIIISSPIGLVTLINEAETAKKEEKDTDFLTSIEIAVLDYVDVILMQNWSHVLTVFEHLNRIPTNQHGTDFMRIREWYVP
jgi:U3 small nucleolar RNA-associated protein 25